MNEDGILVVDDDPAAASYLALVLQSDHRNVTMASSGADALREMEQKLPALVVSDVQMPGLDGVQLLARIKARWPAVPVILVTVEQDVAIVVQAVQLGAVNYLIKPVSPAILVASVARALASRAAKTGGAAGVARPELVGMSRAMVNVRHLIDLASRTDVNVVVTGETGTGKELVARTVHRLSCLAQAPFVAHSCALSTPERFDLEFLGHSAGGLDPLTPERPGLLAQSDGGMLLLDEFECLAQAEQAKLVRILDDGAFRPVGAARSRAVSVRFLAATTRNPSSLLAQGTLRADLYYRLRGFEIHLPPLRERAEDIPQLAEFFLAKQGKRLTPQALQALARSSWPGNIRQLRSVLRYCATVTTDDTVDVTNLIPAAFDLRQEDRPMVPVDAGRGHQQAPRLSLEEAERQVIVQALSFHDGNRSRAAHALGIHRSTLRRRMRDLGISDET